MRFFSTIASVVFLYLLMPGNVFAQFQYISPKPNSIYHNPETNIILKAGSELNVRSLNPELVEIAGSVTGLHSFRMVLAEDSKTILIYPAVHFSEGETVSVMVKDGFEKKSGEKLSGVSFQFTIHAIRSAATIAAMHKAAQHFHEEEFGVSAATPATEINYTQKPGPECTFPEVEITSTGNEYSAPIFLRNQRLIDNDCFARQIISNEGDSVYAVFDDLAGIDFKINYNGYLTYFDKSDSTFAMLDSSYNEVKKFQMGNGYVCDEHEFLIYPDGHSYLMSYDWQPVDMSLIVTGGSPDAIVSGLVIQELDADDNVVFQWRSWDHIAITEAVAQVCLTCIEIEYIHGNSIDLDFDNNLLISCRNMSTILKIDHSTGDVLWKMGGENNEFTFVNDPGPNHFYYQHHFRLLPDGNYSMFNNANYQIPQASSAKVYSLDQVTKTATLLWEYVHPKVDNYYVYGRAMGSVQLLPNGNWLIDWGLLSFPNIQPPLPNIPNLTEVDSAGSIVWELRFKDSTLVTYRAFKFDFIRCGFIEETSLTTTLIGSDSATIVWGSSNNSSSYLFQYKLVSATEWISIPVTTNSITLENLVPQSVYDYRIQSICEIYSDSSSFTSIHQFTTISVASGLTGLKNTSFSIYPNPASLEATVSVFLTHQSKITLSITNVLGEVVYEKRWESTAGKTLFSVPVNHLPKGIYMAQLSVNDLMSRQQLIIQ
ncbi:MAG: arylsulfotransferase family protein [Chitinophagales bacterium]